MNNSSKIVILDHPRPKCRDHFNDVVNAPLSASLNVGYASAICEEAGYEVEYFDYLSDPEPIISIAQNIVSINSAIILIHWVYNWGNENIVSQLIGKIKELSFKGDIGVFGIYPTFCSEDILNKIPGVDMVFVGEFEWTLRDLLSARGNNKNIPGLNIRNQIYKKRSLIENIDTIPFPKDLGKSAKLKYINVAASRGCYGKCGFCSITPYYGKSQWRPRSVNSVCEEIDFRLRDKKERFVYFVDPNFIGPGRKGQERAKQLAVELKKLNIKFGFETRVNDIEPETINLLAGAGLETVFLGIESASIAVLKKINKGIVPEQSVKALNIIRDAGVYINVGFIMFEPGSTLRDIQINFDFLKKNNLLSHHSITSNILYHNQIILKGTTDFNSMMAGDEVVGNDKDGVMYECDPDYKDRSVKVLKDAMTNISLSYYENIDNYFHSKNIPELKQFQVYKGCISTDSHDNKLNTILIDSFESLLSIVINGENKRVSTLVNSSIKLINNCFKDLETVKELHV